MVYGKPLGEILIEKGAITEGELQEALNEQSQDGSRRLGEILMDLGHVDQEDVNSALAEQMGIEEVDLAEAEIDRDVIERVPRDMANLYKILPVDMADGAMRVALSDPTNFNAVDSLSMFLGCDVVPVLVKKQQLRDALERYYQIMDQSIETMLEDLTSDETLTLPDDVSVSLESDEDEVESDEAPVIKLVSLLITDALKSRASDIHIEPFEKSIRIRYRVDGVLHEVPAPPKRFQNAVLSRIKIMSGMNIAEKRIPQDGRIQMKVLDRDIDLRVSDLPTIYGETIVMRILDKTGLLLGLGELGFLEDDQDTFERLIKNPNGIFLVTGPTGSGKTTTLYGVLNTLNIPDVKIITIEDPVEYMLSGINQVQVRTEIELTFERGLRTMLRQAPNIIMVGEIRDLEAGEIAIRAALTGHLVFSTLHTNDAPSAITRLVDMGIQPFLVASAVRGVMAQRLVRQICPNCKVEYTPEEHQIRDGGREPGECENMTFYKGEGCDLCHGGGYKGRKGIFEIMVMDEELQELALQRVPSTVLREVARKNGMHTLREDAWLKVERGITTLDEIIRVTQADVSISIEEELKAAENKAKLMNALPLDTTLDQLEE